MNRFLIAPLMAAVVLVVTGGAALARGAFPAPLPGQASQPPVNSNPPAAAVETAPKNSFPSNGAQPIETFDAIPLPGASGECEKGYASLREDAEIKSKSIAAARERHASPLEACKLISNYRAAEAKLFKYVEMNASRCTIPARFTQQLKAGLARTEVMETKVCTMAREMQNKHAPAGPTGDFWPTSTDAPI